MSAATWEWTAADEDVPYDQLPPDLTQDVDPSCTAATGRFGYFCTRLPGHTGRHAAGTGRRIVAVWRDPSGGAR